MQVVICILSGSMGLSDLTSISVTLFLSSLEVDFEELQLIETRLVGHIYWPVSNESFMNLILQWSRKLHSTESIQLCNSILLPKSLQSFVNIENKRKSCKCYEVMSKIVPAARAASARALASCKAWRGSFNCGTIMFNFVWQITLSEAEIPDFDSWTRSTAHSSIKSEGLDMRSTDTQSDTWFCCCEVFNHCSMNFSRSATTAAD